MAKDSKGTDDNNFMQNTRHTNKVKTQIGSGLVDYVIPTALIAIVAGISIHQMHTSGLLLKFFGASMDMHISTSQGQGVITGYNNNSLNNIKTPGFLGGKPDNPVKVCKGNECTIDFGNVILHNIPDNFGSYVETNGNAGGTNKLLTILAQLKAQLEQNPDVPPGVIAQIQGLLDRGYELVDIEKEFETFYDSAKDTIAGYNEYANSKKTGDTYFNNASPIDILRGINVVNSISSNDYGNVSLKNGNDTYEITANFDNISKLLDPTAVFEYEYGTFTGTTSSTGINGNFYDYINNTNSLSNINNPSYQALSPMGQFLEQVRLLNIDVQEQTNSEIASSVQLLTNLLSEEIFDLAQNVKFKTSEVNTSTTEIISISENIKNMLNSEIKTGLSSTTLQALLDSKGKLTSLNGSPSTETDIDLHMICKSRGGKVDDTNKTCIEN